jgi:hypothetical protein
MHQPLMLGDAVTLCVELTDCDCDEPKDTEGEPVCDGEIEQVVDTETVEDGECEADGEIDGLTDMDCDAPNESEGEVVADGEGTTQLTARMRLFEESETKRSPTLFMAMPKGLLKVAALPIPLMLPVATPPALPPPASVKT